MAHFRRVLPSFAALLAVLVVVQTTDLVACADEAEATEHENGSHADTFAQGGHPTPEPGSSHDDEEHGHEEASFADCLCHVVFAPTAFVPDAGADRAPESVRFAAVVETPPDVEPTGLDHVPLA